MKSCPTCHRVYSEDSVKFCRLDGAPLVDSAVDESYSPTLILTGTRPSTELPTQVLHDSGPSIAVLPFVNMSTDPENEYFCDGLAEELLNALTKIQGLRVASRTSAFAFKGKEIDVREIGGRLNVSTVLEGSVRKAAKRLRITAQLINVKDGYHLWSERYDSEMEDVFAIQDEITLSIVRALRLKLLGEEKAEVLKRYTENTAAYELYLKGRYHLNKFLTQAFDFNELNLAEKFFVEAIESDADFALAHSSLGTCYLTYVLKSIGGAEYNAWAKEEYQRALAIDPELVEPRVKLSYIDLFEGHSEVARQEVDRLMRSETNEPSVYSTATYIYRLSGQYDRALKAWDEFLRLSPGDIVFVSYNRARIFMYQLDLEKAKAEIAKGQAYEPHHPALGLYGAQIDFYLGEVDKARAAIEDILNTNTVLHWPKLFLGFCYLAQGERQRALDLMDKDVIAIAEADQDAAYWLASVYALDRNADKAIEWLKYAVSIGNENYPWFKVDPNWENMRDDPRYQAIMENLKARWEKLSAPDASAKQFART